MQIIIDIESELDAKGIKVPSDQLHLVKEQAESTIHSYLEDYFIDIVKASGASFREVE